MQTAHGLLEDVIRAIVPEGEMVVHWDLVVTTRCGGDLRAIQPYHVASLGSDPEVSLGKLMAATDRLRLQISSPYVPPALGPAPE